MKKIFTAFVEYDDESKLYVGIIPNVPGAHTQAESLDELQINLQEVLELCLEENPEVADERLHFVGTQQVEVAL
jgi:predicted RNase H-like HicB family nuclease